MLKIRYEFNGKPLETLTEKEKAECNKEFKKSIYNNELNYDAFNEIKELLKPAKKIDVATDKIIEDVFSSCFLTKQGKDVYIDRIEAILKDVYGDD